MITQSGDEINTLKGKGMYVDHLNDRTIEQVEGNCKVDEVEE